MLLLPSLLCSLSGFMHVKQNLAAMRGPVCASLDCNIPQESVIDAHLAALGTPKLLTSSSIRHQTAIIRGFICVLLLLLLTKLSAGLHAQVYSRPAG
jgi:hypothetical protein